MDLAFPDGAKPPGWEGFDITDLLVRWGRGERTVETWLAFGGFLLLVFLVALLVFAAAVS